MREVADFNENDFTNPEDNKGVYGKFYYVAKKDEAESAAAGRPVFKDVEYIEIVIAGSNNNIIKRPVEDKDRARFPKSYNKFKEGDLEQIDGTLLSEVTWINRSVVEELRHLRVTTLEQLATLNDQVCTTSPGMFELKRKAAAWLKKSEDAAPFTVLHKENEELRARLAALENAMVEKETEKKTKKSAQG